METVALPTRFSDRGCTCDPASRWLCPASRPSVTKSRNDPDLILVGPKCWCDPNHLTNPTTFGSTWCRSWLKGRFRKRSLAQSGATRAWEADQPAQEPGLGQSPQVPWNCRFYPISSATMRKRSSRTAAYWALSFSLKHKRAAEEEPFGSSPLVFSLIRNS